MIGCLGDFESCASLKKFEGVVALAPFSAKFWEFAYLSDFFFRNTYGVS